MGQFHWYWVFNFSYFAWLAMEIWVLSRDRRTASGTSADHGSIWFILAVFVAGLTAAFYASFRCPTTKITEFRFPIFLSGIALIWAGMSFRLWAIITLGKFFRITVRMQDSHQLVTAGPYKILRHPSYTGGLITCLGIGLALGNWLSTLIMLATPLIGYSYRIREALNKMEFCRLCGSDG